MYGNGLVHRRVLDVDGRLLRVGSPAAGQSELQWRDDAPQVHYRSTPAGGRAAAEATLPLLQRASFQIMQFGMQPTSVPMPQATSLSHALELAQRRYDARGRLTEDAQRRYVWDGLDRLIEVRAKAQGGQAEPPIARYRYNLFGERIAKVVYCAQGQKVTYFFHEGGQLTAETDASGQVTRGYVYLDERPVAMLQGRAILAIYPIIGWRPSR
ncbi:MAG TPA: hypothetical protein VFP68_01090 [Burkholderiaceae bacterium]|nr:hypothetical protein [Burkholderiaceae bacterium]